jgi:serine/threonine-protein kinase ATR
VYLANNLIRAPDTVGETLQLIGLTRQNFFATTLQYTLPALVVDRNQAVINLIASIVKQTAGIIIVDYNAQILAKIFLSSADGSLKFLVDLLHQLTRGHVDKEISAASLMATCMVPLVVSLVVELGDEDQIVTRDATAALLRAQQALNGEVYGADLGAFLKPHMLGVISHMNEMLHDIQGRKSVEHKRKIIRSLGALIKLVGDSMASFSPQVCRDAHGR